MDPLAISYSVTMRVWLFNPRFMPECLLRVLLKNLTGSKFVSDFPLLAPFYHYGCHDSRRAVSGSLFNRTMG